MWARVPPGRVLELGVGTGKNIRHHPAGSEIVALDISEKMLLRARGKAERSGGRVAFELSDAPTTSASRCDVRRRRGELHLLPGARSTARAGGGATGARAAGIAPPAGARLVAEARSPVPMRWFDPVPFHVWGAHIDRDTVANVRDAGFAGPVEDDLSLDIVKLIEAEAPLTHDRG